MHLKFIFATTEPEKVIPTIRSRTHHYPFRLVPPAILRELLEEILSAEKVDYEPAVLPVVIRAGAGSVRDTLSVLDQLIAGADDDGLRYDRAITLLGYTDDALLDEMAEAFAASDGALVFGGIDHVVEAGHDPRRFALDLLDRLRDLIVLAAVPDAGASGLLEVPEDRLDRMREQAKKFGQDRLVRAAETISNGLVEMRGAASPRLLLELMCAQVLLPAAPLPADAGQPAAAHSELDARIDRLERELAAAMERLAAVSRQPEAHRATAPARAPARAEPEPQAAVPRAAAPDTSVLRARWGDVLEAVKDVRKVAWILLGHASVESVDGNVLTLGFDSEGNAKGFSNNGCDQVLAEVLDRMFGTRPVIRGIVQPGPARPAAPSPPPAERAPANGASAEPQKAPRQEERPPPAKRKAGTRSPGPKAQPPRPDPVMSDDPRSHTDADAPGSADDLIGTDLIMRELGGTVIEEIGEG